MSWEHVARVYRVLEYAVFGRALERCREYRLPMLADGRRVLVVGDGDGRFVARLAASAPAAQIDVVDSSAAMLRLARRRWERLESAAPVRFYCSDILDAPLAPGEYDLLVTHFFLDCFDEAGLALVVKALAQTARPGARWVISEFQEPASGAWKYAGRGLIATMYAFFRLSTGLRAKRLPIYAPGLEAAGFRVEKQRTFLRGLLASEVWNRNPATASPEREPGEARPC